jgi:hypothetical protein
LSRQTSVLDFCKSSAGIRASLPVLLDTGNDGPDGRPAAGKEVRSSQIIICLLLLCPVFHVRIYLFLGPSRSPVISLVF